MWDDGLSSSEKGGIVVYVQNDKSDTMGLRGYGHRGSPFAADKSTGESLVGLNEGT